MAATPRAPLPLQKARHPMPTTKSVHAAKDNADAGDRERFAKPISHRVPFSEVGRVFQLALTPGATKKVVVTFDEASHL